MTAHITRGPTEVVRRIIRCPSSDCRRPRRHVLLCQDWYDPIATCCHCGFTRGMANHYRRKDPKAAARAKRRWETP